MELLIYILFYIIQVCLSKQTWQEEPSYTEVNPGERAVLACKIFNKEGTCSWQKDGKPQGLFKGKIEWAGNQTAGDCSLSVFGASDVDDGDWECQVTASSFNAHDALTSKVVNLVVRVAPNSPQLEIGNSKATQRHNFTVKEGTPVTIKCLSRYGNPPARIRWFLGSEELAQSKYNQTNHTETDTPKTWMAVSTLTTSFMKEDHRRALRCVSVHKAYGSISKDVSIVLDIHYSPTVTLQGAPLHDIEEGQDRVALQCLSDANPIANIIWKRVGEEHVFSFQETVEFNPATREHSGTYACKASNSVGISNPLSVRLDVKYPPKIVEVGPNMLITANLHDKTLIQCRAIGDPIPNYDWFQVTPTGRKVKRGTNSTLIIEDVTYEHQGQYFCVAYNIIKGSRKDAHSKPVALEVIGKPHVLRYTVERLVSVERGDDALIQMAFCSKPQPMTTTWEWGSMRFEVGQRNERYHAERLTKESGSSNCYRARLKIKQVGMTDAKNYYLTVKNDRGEDRYAVTLRVEEPVTMTTVIIIVICCLVVLVIITMIMIYAFKTEKCCFSRLSKDAKKWRQRKITDTYTTYATTARSDFKTAGIENNKHQDIEYQKNGHGLTGPNCHSKHVTITENNAQNQQWQ